MDEKRYAELKLGERGAIISIIAYIFLSGLKIYVGNYTNSAALKADGMNNATDIIASIAILIGLRYSRKPADANHPYGHWKAETVASMVASFIMMVVGIQVLYEAVTSITNDGEVVPDLLSAWTGILSAVIMFGVYAYNHRLSKKINSQAIEAAAKDNLSDALVSVGAVVGIIGSQFNLPWLDPFTAAVVGVIICKTAWDIFRDTTLNLTDGFDRKQLEQYRQTVKTVPNVKKVKKIKARRYGSNIVVDVIILVDEHLNIKHGHDIATDVEHILMDDHQVYNVHVHVEPNIKTEKPSKEE